MLDVAREFEEFGERSRHQVGQRPQAGQQFGAGDQPDVDVVAQLVAVMLSPAPFITGPNG